MSATQEILDRAQRVLIGNYARMNIVMVRGQGSELWDSDGRMYLDLFAGFGGAILGHCHPDLIAAAGTQMTQLWHVGNTLHTEPQIELAERLNRTAFAGQAFFCHSGLEANEAGCKLARLYGQTFSPKRWKIISFTRSFHGRSLAMIAATGNLAVKEGFGPVVPGFTQIAAGSFDELAAAVDEETAGILIEPIQGEGGIHTHSADFIGRVRRLCDERKLALIFDEVWSGCGRTGRWFGYQNVAGPDGKPIEPDIMTLGKALGGGLPAGAMFAKPAIARLLVPGKHGCTLGGNPICMAVARAIFDVIQRDRLLEHTARLGERAIASLNAAKSSGKIVEVRGRGLMLGIELSQPPARLVERAMESGIVVNLTAQKVVRVAPALTISTEQLDRGLDVLIRVISECVA